MCCEGGSLGVTELRPRRKNYSNILSSCKLKAIDLNAREKKTNQKLPHHIKFLIGKRIKAQEANWNP
jgi:hypothetical protein